MVEYTKLWYVNQAPEWLPHLPVGKPCNALELGAFEGWSANWLLDGVLTHRESYLTCVDTWAGSARGDKAALQKFEANVGDRCVWHEMDAALYLRTCTQQFDLVHIDINDGRRVLEWLVGSWPLLNAGGVLLCDNNCMRPTFGDVPARVGTSAFLTAYGSELEILYYKWQVIARKL